MLTLPASTARPMLAGIRSSVRRQQQQEALRFVSSSSAFRARPRNRPTSAASSGTQRPSNNAQRLRLGSAGAGLAFTLPFSLFGFGSGSSVGGTGKAAPDSVDVTSNSSILRRDASPAAMRRQATTLVFLSAKGERRDEWRPWIGYFREAGFDVIDANVDANITSSSQERSAEELEHKVLADELGSQVRLWMLQRQPLLFLRSSPTPVALVHEHIHARSTVSGVVIVAPGGQSSNNDAAVAQRIRELADKLGGRVKVVADTEEGIRESESWLVAKGY